MTHTLRLRARHVAAALLLAGGAGLQPASAVTITVVPVADQRTNFPEGPQASVMFTILNPNQDPMQMTSAQVGITGPLSGDGFDVASNPQAAQNQCQNIAAFNVKTQTPGSCTLTVTFSTTDTFTSDPESTGDLVTWKLGIQVTARSLTHPSNSPQTATNTLVVGVYDTSLPEPSAIWLLATGGILMTVGAWHGKRRRQHGGV